MQYPTSVSDWGSRRVMIRVMIRVVNECMGAVQVSSLCVARVAHHQHLHVRVGHLIQGLALHQKVEAKTSV